MNATNRRLTTAEFIERAYAEHGNKYDYSQAVYINKTAKIRIICPKHGLFEQNAGWHMKGTGCPRCSRTRVELLRRGTIDTFLTKARAVHSEKYDYSQAVYRTNTDNVKIICPEHGLFEQTPNSHTQGRGCPKCARTRTTAAVIAAKVPTTPEFITKARAVHGEKYDYSQTEYKSSHQKITVLCRNHGPFSQAASGHLAGQGCPRCAGKTGINHSIESFLQYAKTVHGDKYDYSRVMYTGLEGPVLIGCPIHGEFEQVARIHMRGSVCPRCSLDKTAVINRSLPPKITPIQWVERAIEVHGHTYDYSLFNLRRLSAKVKIICPKHGEFNQAANMHLQGQGCFKCGRERVAQAARLSWIEQAGDRLCTLYFLRIYSADEEFFKVGITSHSVEWRYRNKNSLSGYRYEVLAIHQSYNATAVYDWEQSILDTFSHLRHTPKRSFDGETECFSDEREILSIFPL